MGKPAVRVGDTTSHGTPLGPGPGSSNVLIGGIPAWRVGSDFHNCPLVSGTIPHIGGVVSIGSATVFINNMPATRVGDQIMEGGGGPNAIATGEFSVLIG
jgi:uncharacterized Zn-binding protein involved in type VI secretion